ncbi:class III lanthipeptide [Nocardia sp. NPDC088792]
MSTILNLQKLETRNGGSGTDALSCTSCDSQSCGKGSTQFA